MTDVFQNPFNNQEQPSCPGRVITRRDPWRAPLTNRTVELITMIDTFEVNGIIKTEEIGRSVVPPLDDGTVPSSTSEIRECSRCFSLISFCNSFTCTCGRTFCLACSVTTEIDGYLGRLCVECEENEHSRIIRKLSKWLWGC